MFVAYEVKVANNACDFIVLEDVEVFAKTYGNNDVGTVAVTQYRFSTLVYQFVKNDYRRLSLSILLNLEHPSIHDPVLFFAELGSPKSQKQMLQFGGFRL